MYHTEREEIPKMAHSKRSYQEKTHVDQKIPFRCEGLYMIVLVGTIAFVACCIVRKCITFFWLCLTSAGKYG